MFKDHKISAVKLLDVIPEALLSHLSLTTKVDHYTKVLNGKKMFYLLLYGILENDRLSQRTLEDTFNDTFFKTLFDLDPDESIRRSSISERLAKIDVTYFKEIYECIYQQFKDAYTPNERTKHLLTHVDSTMVSEAASKLTEDIDHKNGKKSVKYSVSFDGLLPSSVSIFNKAKYASEDIALPEAIKNHLKQESHHQNIYVIDRGLQSTRTMRDFTKQEVLFIARAKENRKYNEIANLISPSQNRDLGELSLLKDSKVIFYTGKLIHNTKGNTHYKEELIETPLRLIIAKSKQGKEFWFITNHFELSPKQITDAYRKRWDIEVFFRFIKQELNVSHLVSLNKNGIQVMLYMTLIVAMLILMYKKINQIGYKTAKRRFNMEVRNLIIAIIIEQCGGDPNKFKT